jgi:hypothetical protein
LGFSSLKYLKYDPVAERIGVGLQNPLRGLKSRPGLEMYKRRFFFGATFARVAELADAADLRSAAFTGVPVRLRPRALRQKFSVLNEKISNSSSLLSIDLYL